jgi:hypothetical protein
MGSIYTTQPIIEHAVKAFTQAQRADTVLKLTEAMFKLSFGPKRDLIELALENAIKEL